MHSRLLPALLLLAPLAGCATTPAARGGAIAEPQPAAWSAKRAPLMTRWAAEVTPQNALAEYPRPTLRRAEWQNLNGLWQFAPAAQGEAPPSGRALPRQILVPFPIESALSGVMERHERAWYRRSFTVPAGWRGRRVLLHFGAVDWEASVYVNGRAVGTHRGGYDGFSFDVTDALRPGPGPQELVVGVYDPTDDGVYPRGKQVEQPGGIFYTSVTGIWQTVWLEPVAPAHVAGLRLTPDVPGRALRATVQATGAAERHRVRLQAREAERVLATAEGRPGEELRLALPGARLWTPDDPALYDLRVELLDGTRAVDVAESYFGLRSIEIGRDSAGVTRMLLNGEPVFHAGPLDQGYWPDGLYTAPTDAALRWDVEAAKRAGFNLIRKHAKVEPERWYYWTDRLGLLVWQDMPSVHPERFAERQTAEHRRQFETELRELVTENLHHPSVVMWVVFNEGWGQYDTERLTARAKQLDPSRLVSNASGWVDKNVGDLVDMHRYPDPGAFPPEPTRASVLGEFGGLSLPVEGHVWQTRENWGYQSFTTPEALRARYEGLWDEVWRLQRDAGLSAAVYTQITDVETEINGLLTYDRAVWKIAPETLRAYHREREMVSLPRLAPDGTLFLDSVRVSLANRNGEPIRYTLDGSVPDAESPLYTGAITLKQSATLTARSFAADGRASGPVSAAFTRETTLRPAERVARSAPGLAYDYYEGEWSQLPDFDALTPAARGVAPKFDLSARRRDDHLGFRFQGYVQVPRDGVYTFYSESDDGSRLFVGDRLLADNDGIHGMTEKRGQIALQAGRHPITVVFFEGRGGEGLVVRWEGPGLAKQEIPASALSHAAR